MGDRNHFQLLWPVISGLAAKGVDARVFTDRRLASEVERAGAKFVDLYAGRPLDEADDRSMPHPCRYVSFAGRFADQVAAQVEALGPELIVYETFSVVAWVVARMLGLPYVNVAAGHHVDPADFLPRLESDPRVDLSPRCLAAVEVLRERHGIADASPFSYISGISPLLNLYPEPGEYLDESERRAFEPLAFFGSLPPTEAIEARRDGAGPMPFTDDGGRTRLYVSFGTIIWRYWQPQALEVLGTISRVLAGMPDLHAVIDLWGSDLEEDALTELRHDNVTVERRADQWRALSQADATITHQGLLSTHESTFHRVPMISHPFFWDQPALARRCREMGIAVPLIDSPFEPVTPDSLRAALTRVLTDRESMLERLDEARRWELRTLAGRGAALDRALGLIEGAGA
jgi:UDP:flavonoid glycosyltransferase YjiC (YdhE family)